MYKRLIALKKSLLFRVGLAMTTIISLAVIGMLSSVFIAETAEGFAAAINQSGTLRMQSYRIASSMQEERPMHSPKTIAWTQALVEEFEQRLHSDRIHHVLPKRSRSKLMRAYLTVEKQWNGEIRPLLDLYLFNARQGNVTPQDEDELWRLKQLFMAKVDDFVDDVHFFVKVLEDEAENKIKQLRVIQLIALVLTLLVVAVIMQLMRVRVLGPLKDLLACAEAARRGDLSWRTRFDSHDELGQLGGAFNLMAEDLSAMYSDLEARVQRKTADLERSNKSLELLYLTTKRLSEYSLSKEVLMALLKDIEQLIGIRGGTICLGQSGDEQAYRYASTRESMLADRSKSPGLSCEQCFGQGNSHMFLLDHASRKNLWVFSAPIKDQSQQYGVLIVDIDSSTGLEEWQKRLLEAVASHIAMAINMSDKASQSRRIALLEERSVIARELHDSLAQSLSYLKIQVSRLEKAIVETPNDRKVLTITDELRDGLNGAYRQLRELLTTFRLRISERGLSSALAETVADFQERWDISIELDNQLCNCKFTPNQEIHIIQIVREALSNVVRHSKADAAKVFLGCEPSGMVTVNVQDNGIGLNAEIAAIHHYGMAIMKERAQGLGGELEILDSDMGGTCVQVRFDVSNTQAKLLPVEKIRRVSND